MFKTDQQQNCQKLQMLVESYKKYHDHENDNYQ